jgi:Tfp pilus assembly protein PilW
MFLNASNYSIRLDRTRTNPIASGDNAPNTPTLTSITQTAQGTSPYAPDPDTYDYAVVAVNQYGQMSAPLTAGLSGVVVGAASKVTIVVAEGGTSNASNVATAYQLQRRKTATPADNTTWQLVTTFASLTLVDDGTWLPGTDCMFMFEFDTDQVLAFHQLMDMALFPLGAIADAVRWFQRLYGTLIVYNPLKVICFKNVGSIPNA